MSLNTSSKSPEFTLVVGDASEIVQMLQKLGASEQVLSRANASFQFRKIPGAKVEKVLGGFQIGESVLPEIGQGAMVIQSRTHSLASGIMAANDERFAVAA